MWAPDYDGGSTPWPTPTPASASAPAPTPSADSSFDLTSGELTDITGDKSLLIGMTSQRGAPSSREDDLLGIEVRAKNFPIPTAKGTVEGSQNLINQEKGEDGTIDIVQTGKRKRFDSNDSLIAWQADTTDESAQSEPSDRDSSIKDESDFSTDTPDDKKVSIKEYLPATPDEDLPSTVTVLKGENGAMVYLVGTAHFSEESQDDVSKVIQKVQPHIVMVELCPQRVNILQLDENTILEEAKNINFEKIRGIVQQNGIFNGLIYILLLNMSAHLTKELGVAPGGEFRRALQEAKNIHQCIIHLGDRPIQITMHRALAALTWYQTVKLIWRLLTNDEPISKEDVEKCKQRELLSEILSDMGVEFPALKTVFVHERDMYLTYSLQVAASSETATGPTRVVGIVGMGHVPGILENWGKVKRRSIGPIMKIPPPTLTSRVMRVSFKLAFVGLIAYAGYKVIPRKWFSL
ncbi:traB domain-containing protein [Arctopsyche grandis]|uniref:traB domain-containing protein n=1 Tax=Arctopsyche grandis TaxID=121162 RepID=UPI00406D8B31